MGKAKTINCCARLTKHPKRQKNSMNMQLHEKKLYISARPWNGNKVFVYKNMTAFPDCVGKILKNVLAKMAKSAQNVLKISK